MERRSREPVAGMIVLGAFSAALCGVALWRDWSPVPWWIGAAGLAFALTAIAWRRGKRRTAWVAGAVVVGLAVAAVPVVEPLTRARAEVAWSLEGSEGPIVATESLILTVDANRVLRARAAGDGAVAWEHEVPFYEAYEDPPVYLAGGVVLAGARNLADPGAQMVALDVTTGEELWTGPAQIAPFVHDGSTLAAYAYDDELGDVHRGIDLDTGEVLWTTPGSRGAWEGVPARTPGPGVPPAAWLADETDGGTFRVTHVSSGAELVVAADPVYSAFGVVDDQLVVQEVRTDPEEISRDDVIPTRVTAYDLKTGGDVAWQVDFDIDYEEWLLFDLSSQLNTVDGSRLAMSTDGENLDVLRLTDGSLVQVPSPSKSSFVSVRSGSRSRTHARWVAEQTALANVDDSRLAVVDLEAGSASLVADPPDSRVKGTARLDGRPVPVWEEARSAPFGREYDHLTALDLSDAASPDLADLGMLPDGTVAGLYAGRVVLVASEEIEDAADDEPQSRVTAMHVLAPVDDAP